MSDTTFQADDEYMHRVCVPLGVGLCGQYQPDIVWFSLPCAVCEMIHELQPPTQCALRDGPCDCFGDA